MPGKDCAACVTLPLSGLRCKRQVAQRCFVVEKGTDGEHEQGEGEEAASEVGDSHHGGFSRW
jgi:hypothetical protein